MVKKGALLLLVMLLSIPGCGSRKGKKSEPKTKKTAFSRLNMPLAGDEFELADGSVRSFFDEDVNEFAKFAQDNDSSFGWINQDEKGLKTVYFNFDEHSVRQDQQERLAANANQVKSL